MARRSKQRECILRVLKSTSCHPTASWIYDQVRQEMPHISLGTVYRGLNVLRREGRISELELTGALNRYDGNIEDHYHFRCERCGRLYDVNEPVDKDINKRVAESTGFDVSYHRLEFRGLCRDCKDLK